ncbi:Hsp20/alpha crystallin family protein [Paenibacillus sp. GCM10023252]|uniref:Hsp20/alpha crystallin family protein n=1 Tax=Paenibacillus sp. GCM10023252 TaxID=3252649 RepID=UPI00361CB48F
MAASPAGRGIPASCAMLVGSIPFAQIRICWEEKRKAGVKVMASKWDEMERWMERQQLPQGFEKLREPGWIEQFVGRMMTRALPEAAETLTKRPANAQFFETHHFVVVKFTLPANTEPEQLRLFIREDLVRLDGLPGGKQEKIKLPKRVQPRRCRALVQDGVLQIKLRKRPGTRTYHEAPIRWS